MTRLFSSVWARYTPKIIIARGAFSAVTPWIQPDRMEGRDPPSLVTKRTKPTMAERVIGL